MVSSNEFIIRAGTLSDADAMKLCAARAYADVVGKLPGLPDVIDGIDEDLKHHISFVAEQNKKLVGFLFAAHWDSEMKIINLAVDPAHSGQGIARALLQDAEQTAISEGKTALELATHVGMAKTRAFYKHLGWREQEEKGNAVFLKKCL